MQTNISDGSDVYKYENEITIDSLFEDYIIQRETNNFYYHWVTYYDEHEKTIEYNTRYDSSQFQNLYKKI